MSDQSGDDGAFVFTVAPEDAGATLLEVLAERLHDVGSTEIKRLLRDRRVHVNDAPCAPDRLMVPGDVVSVELADLEGELFRVEARPLEGFAVLYEDEGVIACEKPAGVTVIAERGDRAAPFLGAVLHHLEKSGHPLRPRVVHRIDKETSGVVLLAKSRDAMRSLSAQFERREVKKQYLALIRGSPLDDQGEIALPIGPSAEKGRKFKMRTGGREAKDALTRFEVAERFAEYTLLRCYPETGRQHQIRAHLEAVGYPLAVDPLYGGEEKLLLSSVKRGYRRKGEKEESPLLARVSLHAARIEFRSPAKPADAAPVVVEAPLPRDFEVALKQLRKWGTGSRAKRR
jgi:23S rRNA pseudouridine1911/1915/1917 synthase